MEDKEEEEVKVENIAIAHAFPNVFSEVLPG